METWSGYKRVLVIKNTRLKLNRNTPVVLWLQRLFIKRIIFTLILSAIFKLKSIRIEVGVP